MIYIQIAETVSFPVAVEVLEHLVGHALSQAGASLEVDLSIILSDDAQLQQLNLAYRGIDAPTDVLSFPADLVDPETALPYLGDVLISVPRAREQAAQVGGSLGSEIFLLTVHGVLHLLGYDHAEPEEKARMWALQEAILETFHPEN